MNYYLVSILTIASSGLDEVIRYLRDTHYQDLVSTGYFKDRPPKILQSEQYNASIEESHKPDMVSDIQITFAVKSREDFEKYEASDIKKEIGAKFAADIGQYVKGKIYRNLMSFNG